MRAIHLVPTKIAEHTNVRRQPNLNSSTELIDRFCGAAGTNRNRAAGKHRARTSDSLASAKDQPSAGKHVGSEPRVADRIAERKSCQDRSNSSPIVCGRGESLVETQLRRDGHVRITLADIEGASLNSNAKVAFKEVSGVEPNARDVIGFKISVVFAGKESPECYWLLAGCKGIGAPNTPVPFVVGIPLGKRSWTRGLTLRSHGEDETSTRQRRKVRDEWVLLHDIVQIDIGG